MIISGPSPPFFDPQLNFSSYPSVPLFGEGVVKKSISKVKQSVGYQFVPMIDALPASQIRQAVNDYKERVVWDVWSGTVSLTGENQIILLFWDFLDSKVLPVGLSAVETAFYGRTAARMVRAGLLPRTVIEQFKKSKSVRTPPNTRKKKSILHKAA